MCAFHCMSRVQYAGNMHVYLLLNDSTFCTKMAVFPFIDTIIWVYNFQHKDKGNFTLNLRKMCTHKSVKWDDWGKYTRKVKIWTAFLKKSFFLLDVDHVSYNAPTYRDDRHEEKVRLKVTPPIVGTSDMKTRRIEFATLQEKKNNDIINIIICVQWTQQTFCMHVLHES